jgi:hypothetical protein
LKSSIRIILVMALLLIVAGCSSPESQLIGKWVGRTGTFEFLKDKTGIINPPVGRVELPANVPFKWEMVGKDTVRLNISINGGRMSIAKFEGKDVLIIEDDKFVKTK